jgi:hypothetical protein
VDIADQLLEWIEEETDRLAQDGKGSAVPIHILLVKMALLKKASDQDMTASTQLSLQIFDRAAIYRGLRDLHTDGILVFVDEQGEELEVSDEAIASAASGDKTPVKFVRLCELAPT